MLNNNSEKNILIFRSESSNEKLESKINNLGYKAIKINMIKYKENKGDYSKYSRYYEYAIVTSRVSAEILIKKNCEFESFLVVSKKTSLIIKDRFTNSKVESFNSIDEIVIHLEKLSIHNKAIYFSGNNITRDIDNVKRVVIYKTYYISELNKNTIYSLNKSIKNLYIMCFSSLTLSIFLQLIKQYKLKHIIESAQIICISKKLSNKASKFFKNVFYSNNLDEDDMLKIITKKNQINAY